MAMTSSRVLMPESDEGANDMTGSTAPMIQTVTTPNAVRRLDRVVTGTDGSNVVVLMRHLAG